MGEVFMEKFSADIVFYNQHPDFIILRIKGQVRLGTLDQIEKNLGTIFTTCRGKKVLIDLTETTYVSSTGWSLFLLAYKRVHDLGGKFLLAGMSLDIYYAFELLEFQEIMDYYPDMETAFQGGVKGHRHSLPEKNSKEETA
jgi:anti-anti-sigma factor